MNADDLWGWIAPVVVWCGYHYSAVFAIILFVLQIIYQTIRIKKLCAMKTVDEEDD